MKSFLSDGKGLSEKDYLMIYTSIIYASIVIPMMLFVLLHPERYNETILKFLLSLSQTASIAYGSIISFFFIGKGGLSVLQLFSTKDIKQDIKVAEQVATNVVDQNKK